jgi:hypothetical protein
MSDFEYINLNEVDPTIKPVPDGNYTLRIVKADVKEGVGKTSGKPYRRFEVAAQIVNNASFGGRQIYDGLFVSNAASKEARYLRKVMDATGVVQEEGQPLEDWFTGLATTKPEFNAIVKTRSYIRGDGTTGESNAIDFNSVQPA